MGELGSHCETCRCLPFVKGLPSACMYVPATCERVVVLHSDVLRLLVFLRSAVVRGVPIRTYISRTPPPPHV